MYAKGCFPTHKVSFHGTDFGIFLYFFQKKNGCVESDGSQVFFFCSFSWFSGSLDPPSAAACAVQSQFFMFGVSLENVSFFM